MATAELSMMKRQGRRAPSPPKRFPFGHLGAIRRDPIHFLLDCRATYGDLVHLRFFNTDAFLLSHPDHMHHVLQKKQPSYDKDLEPLKRLRPVLGDGMLTADGQSWKRQRDVARPAFHGREVQSFGPVITEVMADSIRRWRKAAKDGQVLDMHQEMMHVTLRIAGRALFGADLGGEAEASSDLLNAAMAAGLKRMNALVAAPIFLPTPNNQVLKATRYALERMIDRIITEASKDHLDRKSLLGRLLDDHGAMEPAGRSEQFYDEAITILLAGHETTANALSFALHLLGQHPQIAARLREETKEVMGDRPAVIDDMPKLVYTRMALDETMRLFPPAWIIDRNAVEDDEIQGFCIPKRSLIMISPYVIHRHPAFWRDSERFDPMRFAKNQMQNRPRHAYAPFGFGPRVCIGANFALTEGVMALASLVNLFDVEPVAGHRLRLDPNITLRPKNGLPMRVRLAR